MSGAPRAGEPPPEGDAFAAAVHAAQADIVGSIERAGLRNDPFRYPLAALSTVLGLFPSFLGRIDGAVDRARLPLTAEELGRLEKAAATGADRRAAELAQSRNLRTLLIYGGGFLGSLVVVGTVAFLWGRAAANVAVHETEQRLAAAFQDGPAAAATWTKLMEQNDVQNSLSMCTGPRAYTDAAGRKACLLPMWIEPPRRTAPSEAQR